MGKRILNRGQISRKGCNKVNFGPFSQSPNTNKYPYNYRDDSRMNSSHTPAIASKTK